MISVKELSTELQAAIGQLKSEQGLEETGIVTRVGDGVAWVYGLTNAGFNEVLQIAGTDGSTVEAFALNLMEDEIGAVLLGNDSQVRAGARVKLKGNVLTVPVGPELLGRVVDPLGNPLDGKGPIKAKQQGLVEKPAPGIIARKTVGEPMMTGIMAI
ncbi:MAG TPA: F0F1 ATP synthase subunit alpha, partial [Candidatus Saccharimonas sp.]|nr:F0F1 ATP synthase subunit alpha [Candidatus Saccharimonas sp.]